MTTGSCHCGEVSWSFEGDMGRVTACNCTVCRRYGTLWAYGWKDDNIKVSGPTHNYVWGDKSLGFHFCKTCGCMAYWLGLAPRDNGKFRIAVNTRLADDPDQVGALPIRHFDGYDTFEEGPKDDRCVKDMWF